MLVRLAAGGAALLGVVAVCLLVAGVIVQAASGCGAPDPTDPLNATSVVIVNDTLMTVRVDDCAGTWCQQDRTDLAPGEPITARAACGMSGSEMTSYRITSGAGATLRFIAVHAPRSDDHFTFAVSRASASRAIETPHE